MSKIGIFYGSSTGSTSEVAQRLAKALGAEANVYDVAGADAAEAAAFDVLLLGSSTWGIGDLQDDWEDFLPKLAEQNLAGKKVALFGCGDADSYPDSFCEAIAKLHEGLAGTGCSFIGAYEPEDYQVTDSEINRDGKFIGLALDAADEDKNPERIAKWVELVK